MRMRGCLDELNEYTKGCFIKGSLFAFPRNDATY